MKKKHSMSLMMILIIIAFIVLLNININQTQQENGNAEIICKVIETDDTEVISTGVSAIGYQRLSVEVVYGKHKGELFFVSNSLLGQFEYDQIFKVNDKILVGINITDGQITDGVAIDYYRQNYIIILFGLFAVILLIYSGKIGLKALLSFLLALLIIWFILIPALLNNFPPIPITFIVLILLSGVIIFSVAGFSPKGISAFLGTVTGIIIPTILAVIFGELIKTFGLTAPFAANLMFKGYANLDFKSIFYCAIMIGASGACMDIAMDVAASMNEIKKKKPDIERKELIQSGKNIGRTVIGTMTTTLLLAYAGGYLTLMMLFYEMDTTLVRMLNLKIFSTEIMRILIGSIALVIVAPTTAVISGYILTKQSAQTKKYSLFANVIGTILKKIYNSTSLK